VSRPVSAIWGPVIQTPWYRLPYGVRLVVGWLALLALVFGSAFGLPLTGVSTARVNEFGDIVDIVLSHQNTRYEDRAISVLGLLVFQTGFWVTSRKRSRIPWQVDFVSTSSGITSS
jgi:CNT family concentrative nucleoside transporter